MQFDFFSWVVIPVLIFLARIVDVSLGTMRFIFIARGYRKLAPLVGFVEVLIWLLAIREVMFNLRNAACVLGYCGGYAIGSYVGLWLEEKLSIGVVLVRIVINKGAARLKKFLKKNEFGFTVVEGKGTREKVKVILSIVKRKDLEYLLTAIKTFNPQAFYSIENIKSVSNGVFPRPQPSAAAGMAFLRSLDRLRSLNRRW